MPDYSAFLAAEKIKAANAATTSATHHAARDRAIQTLGRQMEDLVGGDGWASVRKALEAARAGEQAAQAALRVRICAPDTVGEALLLLKLEEQRIAGRIEGLETALRVPETYQAMAALPS